MCKCLVGLGWAPEASGPSEGEPTRRCWQRFATRLLLCFDVRVYARMHAMNDANCCQTARRNTSSLMGTNPSPRQPTFAGHRGLTPISQHSTYTYTWKTESSRATKDRRKSRKRVEPSGNVMETTRSTGETMNETRQRGHRTTAARKRHNRHDNHQFSTCEQRMKDPRQHSHIQCVKQTTLVAD